MRQSNAAFDAAFSQLNSAQRQAVEAIDGPVLVIAGPGTGKTQLLSVRVANVLRQTDMLPGNILCLTFTESAANAMRERLVQLMGAAAHRVAIHTFHSFGTEIINHHPEYFYLGAHFQPADELSSFEVLEPIFAQLSHADPLGSMLNGEFTALPDAQRAIGYLKKAGLTPDELLEILTHNETFMNEAEPVLAKAFDTPRLTLKQLTACEAALSELKRFKAKPLPVGLFKPLHEVCTHDLAHALEQAAADHSTKPLTAWRNRWLERNAKRELVCKDRARARKLRALATIYKRYLKSMEERELFDFDDMIVRVVRACEAHPELRYNLQEQYLYILVDEFQDTNGAQLRLLNALVDNPVHEGRPNIMAVGDDDQAIYAFQGAELGHMVQFTELYREPLIVTLRDNYRSTAPILDEAREVITQGEFRLESQLKGIDKQLTARAAHKPSAVELHAFNEHDSQYHWITTQVQQLIGQGIAPHEIAIFGRTHRELTPMASALQAAGVPVAYERRTNLLESEPIAALVTLARTVVALGEQDFPLAESLLPRLLGYDFWGLKPQEIWETSLRAYKQRRFWLEVMLSDKGRLRQVAEFLVVASHQALHESYETMLDILLGSIEQQASEDEVSETDTQPATAPSEEAFVSPLRAYYFNAEQLREKPSEYLTLLSGLSALFRRMREYQPDQPLELTDFVAFIDLHERTGLPLADVTLQHETVRAVQLMTAHKAKGLEFNTVFVLSCQENVWGMSARRRSSLLPFPANLPVEPAGQTADDCLRLFFVAMTRARQRLYLTSYHCDEGGRESLRASFLEHLEPIPHDDKTVETHSVVAETTHSRALRLPHADQRALLAPHLETYRLSATHLNNFIDVTSGGPQAFLLQNLLRFPQAKSLHATFGSAIHSVLHRAHAHLAGSGQLKPLEDVLRDLDIYLQNARLNDRDYAHLLEKGSDVLQAYLAQHDESFAPNNKAEYSFASQGVQVGEARLTGIIDLLEINTKTKTIIVTDYKTGRPPISWHARDDYERIKLHKYRQQLMMYKLLVEKSRDFAGYTVTNGALRFVEAAHLSSRGLTQAPLELTLEFDAEELARFTELIQRVWQRIMALELPDTSEFPTTYKGIVAFEESLLAL